MNIELPDFLLEMSKQMSEQPNRCTAHPFWQVRCKRYPITEEGYNVHHWILADDDGEFFRSDLDECPRRALLNRFPEFCDDWERFEGRSFIDYFDVDTDVLPEQARKFFVQETEEVISTHMTESDAKWFIKRKQHDHPKLYTYVESAYWAPQLKKLQDWIIGLTND